MVDADDDAAADLTPGSSRGTTMNNMMQVGRRSLTGPGEVAGSRGCDMAGLRLSTAPGAGAVDTGGKHEARWWRNQRRGQGPVDEVRQGTGRAVELA